MQSLLCGSERCLRLHICSIVLLLGAAMLAGCGKVDSDAAPPVPLAVAASAGTTTAPTDPLLEKELPVTESVPVVPGIPVDIVDLGTHSVVVSRSMPKSVAWRPNPSTAAIAYPASGVITFSLSTVQWAALDKAHGLSVRPSEQGTAAEQK